MDLLTLARGPLMQAATTIFVIGVLWRLVGVALLRGTRNLSAPRKAPWAGLRLLVMRSWPRKEFLGGTAFGEVMGYTFHVGLLVSIFFFLPHVLFFEDIAKTVTGLNFHRLAGFDWPTLPGSFIYFLTAISVGCLIAVLIHRVVNPVKRLISNFDDYFSWFVTVAPLATGMIAYGHFSGSHEMRLAVHLLSVELLMVWFPFGKLMHAFWLMATRATQGLDFERKGASI